MSIHLYFHWNYCQLKLLFRFTLLHGRFYLDMKFGNLPYRFEDQIFLSYTNSFSIPTLFCLSNIFQGAFFKGSECLKKLRKKISSKRCILTYTHLKIHCTNFNQIPHLPLCATSSLPETRSYEFGSMTARKGEIKPWKTIKRPFKTIKRPHRTIKWHTRS